MTNDDLKTFREALSEVAESVAHLSDAVRAILMTNGPDAARDRLKLADACLIKAADILWPDKK